MAGVTTSGTEGEDPAEYFDGHEDAGEFHDPLIDGAEADEATKAKQKELDRLAEFGEYETVDLHVALGKEASDDALGAGPQKGRNRSPTHRERG